MRPTSSLVRFGLLAGVVSLFMAAPAIAGEFGYDSGYRDSYPGDARTYVAVGRPVTVAHSVEPVAYRHSRTVVAPVTVYQPVTRSYDIPVRAYQTVETVRTVPVTTYQTVRELHRVPVVTYQTVESYRQQPVQSFQQVRELQQVPVTGTQRVYRTEYQATTQYRTYQQNWCCTAAE